MTDKYLHLWKWSTCNEAYPKRIIKSAANRPPTPEHSWRAEVGPALMKLSHNFNEVRAGLKSSRIYSFSVLRITLVERQGGTTENMALL